MSSKNEGIQKILKEINDSGGFLATALTDMHGFPVATVSIEGERQVDNYSAVTGLVQKTARHAQMYLGMSEMDEVSVTSSDGWRLVCRPFTVNGEDFILSVMVPTKRSYRRLTNKAIRVIKKLSIP